MTLLHMHHYLISKDAVRYQAWPDLALTQGGRLVSVYSECTHHGDRGWTTVSCRVSDDRGKTWSEPKAVSSPSILKETGYFWNCARITTLPDGRLFILCDRPASEEPGASQPNYFWISRDEGETWEGPEETPALGICPDRLILSRRKAGGFRWHLAAHSRTLRDGGEVWEEKTWFSDDEGATWRGPFVIAAVPSLQLCEASLFQLPAGELVCLFRENSGRGLDAFKSVSRDGGETWSPVVEFPLPGCHRPVGGLLESGRVLVTFRLSQGGKGWLGWWTQNFFGALTTVEACLTEARKEACTRLFPIAYDRSPHSDIGYSGWVQFPDGEIHVAYYLVDDHGRGHIRGCAFRQSAVVLDSQEG